MTDTLMHWSILSDQRKQSFKSFKQHRQRLDDLSKYLVGFENFFWFEKWSEISLKEWRPFKLPKNVVLVDEKRLFKLPKNRSSIVFGHRNRFGHSLVPAFRFLNSFKLRADSISSTLQPKVVAASFFCMTGFEPSNHHFRVHNRSLEPQMNYSC